MRLRGGGGGGGPRRSKKSLGSPPFPDVESLVDANRKPTRSDCSMLDPELRRRSPAFATSSMCASLELRLLHDDGADGQDASSSKLIEALDTWLRPALAHVADSDPKDMPELLLECFRSSESLDSEWATE